MAQYVARRLLLMVPTLLGITFVTFLIIRLAPGDPVAFRLGTLAEGARAQEGGGQASADRERQILAAKVRLGLMRERGTIRLWDGERESRRIDALASEVRCVAIAPGGALLAAGCADGSVTLWTARGEEVASLRRHAQGVNAVAFSPDGRRLASASDDRTVRIWRSAGGKLEEERILAGHEGVVHAVAFDPAGARVASGSRDRTARVWDLESGREVARLREHVLDVTALAFAPDGRLFTGSRDRRILAWDLAAARPVAEAETPAAVRGLALSPAGDVLAAALDNGAVQLREAATLGPRAELAGHLAAASAVAFTDDGSTVVSSSADKSLRLWDAASGAQRALLTGHTAQVNAVAASPSGGLVASGALEAGKVPLLVAYGDWLSRLLRLDFGRSFKDGRPVMAKVGEALPITLKLNVTAILLTYLLSIPIGVLAAARRGRFFDQASSFALFVLYSMPSFWVATMLIIVVGSPAGFFAKSFDFTLPFVGLHAENAALLPYTEYLKDHFLHLILPIVALTYGSFAFLSQLVRTGMLEVLGLDFVRTARAKGLAERVVVAKHALRNSLIPVTTVLGNILPALIGGSVIIEYIFTVPGMGWLGFDAILQRDYPVIMAITTLAAVLTMLGILLSDILYCVVDPRIKLE